MTYEPSDAMVEAAFRHLFGTHGDNHFRVATRRALRAAFAAAIESGEAKEAASFTMTDNDVLAASYVNVDGKRWLPCIILRTQTKETP
jgi:hypothetical protein